MAIAALMLGRFADPGLTQEDLLARLAWLRDVIGPRMERYLGYYRNPMTELAAACGSAAGASFLVRPWRQYQEIGLPARITGFRRAADGGCAATGIVDVQRKEVVIENDIAWRMDTVVDFAAARLPGITSTARDAGTRGRLNGVIAGILDAYEGGVLRLLQELVLRGAIAGTAWVHVRPSEGLLGADRGRGERCGGRGECGCGGVGEAGVAGCAAGLPGDARSVLAAGGGRDFAGRSGGQGSGGGEWAGIFAAGAGVVWAADGRSAGGGGIFV